MNAELKRRWATEPGHTFIENLCRWGRSGNGFEITESPFGRVAGTGLIDLRSLVLPEHAELRRITLRSADCTAVSLKANWIEMSVFSEVLFDEGSLHNLGESGSAFERCSFRGANFRRSRIGYGPTRFTRCHFVRADFIQAGFVRPEFDYCSFDNCTFSGVNFNGASFERCEFRGEVRGVWFHGGFQYDSDREKYGEPRPNKMTGVSFRNAKLVDVTFSDRCDLSSVVPPDDKRQAIFDRWPERIRSVFEQSRTWAEPFKKEGENFLKACAVHARNQDWYVIGLDTLVSMYGKESGAKIWEALLATNQITANNSTVMP